MGWRKCHRYRPNVDCSIGRIWEINQFEPSATGSINSLSWLNGTDWSYHVCGKDNVSFRRWSHRCFVQPEGRRILHSSWAQGENSSGWFLLFVWGWKPYGMLNAGYVFNVFGSSMKLLILTWYHATILWLYFCIFKFDDNFDCRDSLS